MSRMKFKVVFAGYHFFRFWRSNRRLVRRTVSPMADQSPRGESAWVGGGRLEVGVGEAAGLGVDEGAGVAVAFSAGSGASFKS